MVIKRKELYGLLYGVLAFILAAVVLLNYFALTYSNLISGFFGQATYRIESTASDAYEDTEYYKLNYTSSAALEADERDFAERVQSDGVILLQNNNLPLTPGNVTFLGIHARDDMLSAGVSVSENAPAMAEKFSEAGFTVNTDMISYYAGLTEEADPAVFSDAAKASVQNFHDLAVIVLFSGGAEARDITVSDLRFTDTEKSLIRYAAENFTNVVVMLNTTNTVECGYLEQFSNLSVLYINFSGDAGIGVIPRILTGEISPSGKTVDTFAYDVEYPIAMLNYETSAEDQGIMKDGERVGNYVNYTEGIYVGYRYFETRYEDSVLGTGNAGSFDYAAQVQYPFGYGLSYTTFDFSDFTVSENPDSFTLSVKVTNTGSTYSGKQVAEFYMQSPYTEYDRENGIEKASVQLVGFAKTKVLVPGESQTVSAVVSKSELRAYDANKLRTYIVDAGTYYFTVGSDSHDAVNNILAAKAASGIAVDASRMTSGGSAALVGAYTQAEFDSTTYSTGANGEKITNLFDDVNMNHYYPGTITYVSRNNWMETIPAEKAGAIDGTEALLGNFNPVFEPTNQAKPVMGKDSGLTLVAMRGLEYDNEMWDTLLDQFTAEELMSIVAYGGFKTAAISSINKPASVDKDGPAGLDSTQLGGARCYTFPSDSMFACTWNTDLIGELGYFISQDCLLTGTTGWYAPACNIHRVAVCGRTREYFSEDPFLSGAMSYAIASSAQKNGVVTYTKHFALNEQENNRSSVCTFSNEQAIREIYLKPFEMALAEGGSLGLMTSMNRVGTVYSSSQRALCTGILRDEWGWNGVVITDFVGGPNAKVVPREMVLAGTDLFLCTLSGDSMFVDNYQNDADILNALRESAHRICYAYVNSNVVNGLSSSSVVVPLTPPWINWMVALDAVLLYVIYLFAMTPVFNALKKKEER